MAAYFLADLLWLLAGLVAGLVSFGGNLVAVPFITFLMDPKIAILAGCISGTAVFVALAIIYKHNILWKDTFFLAGGAVFGIPAGIIFLDQSGARGILLAAGFALCAFLGWQFFSGKIGRPGNAIRMIYALPFGFVSGLMMGAVGMGGPPLVLYAFLRNWEKAETLGTVNAASVALMLFVIPGQFLAGLYNPEILGIGLQGSLTAIAGIFISIPLVKKINLLLFRRLLLGMLFFSAMILIFRAL